MSDSSEGDFDDDLAFAAKAHSSFEFFAKNVLDQEKFDAEKGLILKDFHKEWIDALEEHDRLAITAFTGSGKTTIVGVCYPIWKAFTEPGWEALIVAPSMDQSKMLLGRIKEHISDSEYLEHLKDTSENTWSTKKIELTNGSVIECKPYTENIKGAHVDYVIADEAAEYEPKSTYHSAVKTRAFRKDGTVALISTPVHENDLMSELSEGHEIGRCPQCGERVEKLNPKDHDVDDITYMCSEHGEVEEPDYDPNVSEKGYWNGTYPALDEEDNPVFPEAFDYDDLMNIKREDKQSFIREYRCESVSVEGDVFQANDIVNCYSGEHTFSQQAKEEASYYMGADFAVSNKGDFSVFTIIEQHPDNDGLLIKYMERLRGVSLPEQERRIKELHKIFEFDKIVLDSSSFGRRTHENLIQEGLPVEGQSFKMAARNSLIVNLKTAIEEGDVIIPRDTSVERTRTLTDKLHEELLGFGTTETDSGSVTYKSNAKHDDTVMSLGMAIEAVDDSRETHATVAFAD